MMHAELEFSPRSALSGSRPAWSRCLLGVLAATACLLAAPVALSAADLSVRERISLDADWRFQKEDPATATDLDTLKYSNVAPWELATGVELTQGSAAAAQVRPAGNPAGSPIASAEVAFDDSQWRL